MVLYYVESVSAIDSAITGYTIVQRIVSLNYVHSKCGIYYNIDSIRILLQ